MCVTVPPRIERVVRATPEPWLRNGTPCTDWDHLAGPGGLVYDDAPVTLQHYPMLYVCSRTMLTLDADGAFVGANAAASPQGSRNMSAAVARMRERLATERIIDMEANVPLAMLSTARRLNYYHFLFDDLARLGFYRYLDVAFRLRFVVGNVRTWHRQFYALAGIEDRLLPLGTNGIHRLHNVWVAPRGLAHIANIRTQALGVLTAMRQNAGPPTRRIYITRDESGHRRLTNEVAVRDALEQHGFEIVRPQHLSIPDQLRLFAECQTVVGIFGAGLTNAVFMQPGASLLELAPPRDQYAAVHNAIFATVAGLCGLRYGLLTGTDFTLPSHDFTVPLPWLERLLIDHESNGGAEA